MLPLFRFLRKAASFFPIQMHQINKMEGFITSASTGSNSVLPSDSEQTIEAKKERKRRDTER